jgi:hypothetical protein
MSVYIYKNNQQFGPFEEAQIFEMLRSGRLSPEDMGIRQGQTQWQPLRVLFAPPASGFSPAPPPVPPNAPSPAHARPQPAAKTSGAARLLIFALLGLGGLLLVAVVGGVAFFSFFRNVTPVPADAADKPAADTGPSAAKAPVFDEKKFGEMMDKKKELAQLSPPLKLDPKAAIKGKVLLVGNFSSSDESTLGGGFSSSRMAKNLDELQTLIQIVCAKGRFLGNFEKGVKAYASDCKVSLIDYKTPAVVARQSFSNGKIGTMIPEKDVRNDEYLTPQPIAEMTKYLNGFALDKVISGLTTLDEKELTRISIPVSLDPNATIKGKIKIVEKYIYGRDEPGSPAGFTFGGYQTYGLPSARLTDKPEELETLIRIICGKGERIGKVENTTEYANRCEVSLVDYRNLRVFAQKTIENKKLDQEARKESFPLDWVITVPKQEIEDYLKNFPGAQN